MISAKALRNTTKAVHVDFHKKNQEALGRLLDEAMPRIECVMKDASLLGKFGVNFYLDLDFCDNNNEKLHDLFREAVVALLENEGYDVDATMNNTYIELHINWSIAED